MEPPELRWTTPVRPLARREVCRPYGTPVLIPVAARASASVSFARSSFGPARCPAIAVAGILQKMITGVTAHRLMFRRSVARPECCWRTARLLRDRHDRQMSDD